MRQAGQQAFHRGNDRILGGVCSGMAAGFHVDPLWVRLAFVILAAFQGAGLFIYIVLWLVMPEIDAKGAARWGFDSMADDLKRVGAEIRSQFGGRAGANQVSTQRVSLGREGLVLGTVLVFMGAVLLAINTGLVSWGVIWPVVVIALGLVLLVRALDRRT
jgi:phage shock protein PspC (stress-responsive transcriptional regulator)